MIEPGQKLPNVSLRESTGYSDETHCPLPPQAVETGALTAGKKVVFFGVPGAFTPTCSGKHLPGYVAAADELRAKGVDEIVCIAVNDGFVMGAWGRDQKTAGKVRMLGDGSAELTKALGVDLDLTANGMGVRCKRFSMLVVDGTVRTINVEAPGKFETSDAATMLKQVAELG